MVSKSGKPITNGTTIVNSNGLKLIMLCVRAEYVVADVNIIK